jgi:hypothetical protein
VLLALKQSKIVSARTERLSVPVIYLDICAYNHSDLAFYDQVLPKNQPVVMKVNIEGHELDALVVVFLYF